MAVGITATTALIQNVTLAALLNIPAVCTHITSNSTFRRRGTSMLDKCNTGSTSFSDHTETKMQGEYRSVEGRRRSVFEAELKWERDFFPRQKKNRT